MASVPKGEVRQFAGSDLQTNRHTFQRDRDRILYSGYFRRLAGVTQVASAFDSDHFHSRLTHTLEVAQIARRLAERINEPHLVDPDVAEAAALAHDLGHPPFGHIGEHVIDEMLQKHFPNCDGFEGNAQSFRIVCKLSVRSSEHTGLDLSTRTLNSVLKYPWMRSDSQFNSTGKFGVYESERAEFKFAREGFDENAPSPEAMLMDYADDIAYSVHDVYDFFKAGLIPLDHFDQNPDTWKAVRIDANQRRAKRKQPSITDDELTLFLSAVGSYLPEERYSSLFESRGRAKTLSSFLIRRYIVDLVAVNVNEIQIDQQARAEIDLLKSLTWVYVINHPTVVGLQAGHKRIMKLVMHEICNDVNSGNPRLLPENHRESFSNGAPRHRVVADYVSSLTERQALKLFRRFSGSDEGSVLEVLSV